MNGNQIVYKDYATEQFVQSAINTAIGNPSGTVTEITVGLGLSASPSTITNVGSIVLDSDLNYLNDVTAPAPVVNQVLTWDGTCWYPAMFGGTGTSPIAFVDLSDTPSTLGSNNLLQTNNNSIVLTPNNYINSVTNGPGIGSPLKINNEVRLEIDLTTYVTTPNSDNTDQFIILQNNGDTRRIAQNNIYLENFKNASSYISNTAKSSLTGTLPITYDAISGTIGLSGAVMTGIDFNIYNVTGELAIENGGTSGSTSFDARVNLGLSYNTDILAFEDPYYNGVMRGTNVRYAPGTAVVGISFSGTGYEDGESYEALYDGNFLSIKVLTGVNGEICSASLDGNFYNNLLYSENNITVQGGGDDAIISIIPEYSYINFGLSQGDYGIGFRNKEGNMEQRYTSSVSWSPVQNVINTLTGMIDMDFTDNSNNILVYKNGKYTSTVLTGQGNIVGDQLNIVGPLDPSIITTFAGETITPFEFSTLDGISSNIQSQLNQKIQSSNTPADTSILYYNSSTGVSSWESLNAYNVDNGKVLTVDFDAGTCGVVWQNPFESIGNSMIPETASQYDIGTSTLPWRNTFTDILNLSIHTVATSPTGICGSLAVFENGNYGEPCLGLYWGTSWRIIGISGGIHI